MCDQGFEDPKHTHETTNIGHIWDSTSSSVVLEIRKTLKTKK